MIDEFAGLLDRPGPDGVWFRSAILEWLWFESPPVDRCKGTQNSPLCGGSPPAIHDPSSGFLARLAEGVRIGPVDAFDLREKLRDAIDRTVCDWLEDRDVALAAAHAEDPFAEVVGSDAEADHETCASKRYVRDIGEFGP